MIERLNWNFDLLTSNRNVSKEGFVLELDMKW